MEQYIDIWRLIDMIEWSKETIYNGYDEYGEPESIEVINADTLLEQLRREAEKEVDDNICHYHINDKDKLVICGCTQEPIASTFSWFNEQTCEYKYCPYCGKEICF